MPPPSRDGARPAYSSADLVTGIVFIVIGVLFGAEALRYEFGTLLNMGPAYFPFVLAAVLVAIGIAVVVKAFRSPSRSEPVTAPAGEVLDGAEPSGAAAPASVRVQGGAEKRDEADEPPLAFGRIPWRSLLLMTAAVATFGLTVEGLGLAPAAVITVLLAAFSRPGTTWRQAVVTAAALVLLSWLIFVVGLQLRIPIIGPWLGGG